MPQEFSPCNQQLPATAGSRAVMQPQVGSREKVEQNSLKNKILAFIITLTCKPFKIFVSSLPQENFYKQVVITSDKFQERTMLIFWKYLILKKYFH